MDYNKNEHSTQDIHPQASQQPNVTPDSPAAYGIRRYDTNGRANTEQFCGGVIPAPGIWEAYKMFWTRYVDFDGRSRRSEYWWPTLINGVIGMVIYFFIVGSRFADLASMESEDVAKFLFQNTGSIVATGIGSLFSLATLVPSIALAVRRLHDLNITGWWYAAMLFNCCGLVSLVFLILFCRDGKPERNEWGESPKYKSV